MTENRDQQVAPATRLNLRQHVLLAALECSEGDLNRAFTAEDLLLVAWRRDPMAWGLRGHEREHPDSEKIYTELDRASKAGKNVKGGLAGLGLLRKIRQRTYCLTAAGLAAASEVGEAGAAALGKAERALADAVSAILSHPVFQSWQKDESTPKNFRDAGHFWGVAPGTPPSVIRARITDIDQSLAAARQFMSRRGAKEVAGAHGKVLFDSRDLERAEAFHSQIKERFARDLATLGVSGLA